MRISLARKFSVKEILLALALFGLFGFFFFVESAETIGYFRNGQTQEGFAEFGKHYLVTIAVLLFLLFTIGLDRFKSYLFQWVCLSGILFSLITAVLIRQGSIIWQVALVFGIALLIFLFEIFKITKSEQPQPAVVSSEPKEGA